MCTSLPNELLTDIIEHLFKENTQSRKKTSAGSSGVKPPWTSIHAIVLTSRTLRAIGLKLWFSRLRVTNEWNWEYISSIPSIYTWVRQISYHNVTSLLIPCIHPKNFPALESVSIRMLNVDKPMSVIGRLPRSVKCLEIWKFDTMVHDDLFSAIACKLPDLRELRLHGMGEVDKFGMGTLFESADTLALSLTSSLSRVQKLQILAIDVYLTPVTILIRHASCPRGPFMSCDKCIREFGDETRANEVEVSLRVANALANLERIEWCSCFRRRRKCTIYVARDREGSVSVSREDEDRPLT